MIDKKNRALVKRFAQWALRNRVRRSTPVGWGILRINAWKIGYTVRWEAGALNLNGDPINHERIVIPVYADRRGWCFCEGKRLQDFSVINGINEAIARHVARTGKRWR